MGGMSEYCCWRSPGNAFCNWSNFQQSLKSLASIHWVCSILDTQKTSWSGGEQVSRQDPFTQMVVEMGQTFQMDLIQWYRWWLPCFEMAFGRVDLFHLALRPSANEEANKTWGNGRWPIFLGQEQDHVSGSVIITMVVFLSFRVGTRSKDSICSKKTIFGFRRPNVTEHGLGWLTDEMYLIVTIFWWF